MKRKALLHIPLVLAAILALPHASHAQLVAGPGVTDATSSQPLSNRTFSFYGTIPGQLDGAVTVTFSIYPDQQSASALWTETQIVQITGEKYSVMLGSTSATGLPPDIFSADQAHWLGVQLNGSEKRFLLVSVPYAMKAVEAERLGGLLPADYVTVQQLQSALQGAAGSTASAPTKTTTSGPTGQAAAAGTPPQPATDFTDNNGTEVLLVTQQGPGYAIHAISNLQPAIYAENSASSGTALQVVETSIDGASTGLFAQTLGPGSIAGVFDSAGPAILELRKNGTRMVFFDQFGDITANGEVRASDFAGSGSGLTNIPNSATTATSSNISNSIVARDFNGGFVAGTIQATSFVGSGFGLTDIPPTAINATPLTINNSVVARDSTGSFSANQILANNFSGSGSGLFNIPPIAINATPVNIVNTVVARDAAGSFSANQVSANNFSGSGAGLTNIPPIAINATPVNIVNTVVARDAAGSFSANQISANNFLGSGAGLTNIPPIAINATPVNIVNTVVARDAAGSFNANQIFATTFFGSGAGLFAVPQAAINATPVNNPFSVVARDSNGNFAANQITANAFSGSGFGLFGIPQSAISATPSNDPSSVVARDANGGFATGNLQVTGILQVTNQLMSTGLVDFSGAVTAPVRTVLTANIPPLCLTSKELLLVTDALPGQQLFVCNSNGNGWVLLGDGGGSGGSSNVSGNTTGTLENVSQLGSGTALTVSSTSGTAMSASSTSGTAMHGDSTGVGAQGSSQGGIGVWAAGTAHDSTGTALLLSHASAGKLISGGEGPDTNIFETFSVTAEGDVTFNGAMMTPYETTGTWFASSLVKLTSAPGNFGAGTVAMTAPGDTSGAIGIISGLPASGSRIQVVQSGEFFCNFDGPATSGHYVGISKTTAGDCADIGASFPTDGQQAVGRVLSSFVTGSGRVLLFQSELHGGGGTAVTINTGAGLTGGPITGSGTISIANSGVTNAMLQNSSVNVVPGSGLSGGGSVSLGGSVTLNNSGVLSFNGRSGGVTAASGDYSFDQISGSAAASQLPALTGDVTSAARSAVTSLSASGVTAGTYTKVTVDAKGRATAGAQASFTDLAGSANASQLPAAVVYNNQANTFTGNQTFNGAVSATSFSGSGAALTGVNAASLNGLGSANFAQLAAANSFTAKQTLAAGSASAASLNIPAGTAPSAPASGDVWNTGSVLQYRDNASTTRSLVSTTQSGGLQLLKLTASITPASVSSQVCTEQSFSISGINTGDVLLGVAQPSTSSPGTNIAIGGFRVSAANTVALQFCNVSRNNSTPTAGVYTFAFMR